MLRISLVCVGKLGAAYLRNGVAEFQKRLGSLCRFQMLELEEEALDEKSGSPALIQSALEKEGRRILAALPKGALVIALCVEGKQLDSEAFARRLGEAGLHGQGEIAFVIGSSHGLAQQVKQRADLRLSLSAMTFPHQLARLLLMEQVYRALMILGNRKYHK